MPLTQAHFFHRNVGRHSYSSGDITKAINIGGRITTWTA